MTENTTFVKNFSSNGHQRHDISELLMTSRPGAQQPPGRRFQPMTMAELLARPRKQWLIDGVVGVGDLAMIYGASGCGKTHVIIDLIFSACTGIPFARRFAVARELNVAYCAGEGVSGLPQRFGAVQDFYSAVAPDADYSNFTFFETVPQLYIGEEAAGYDHIAQFIVEWKDSQAKGEAQPLDLLIIDTLHTAAAGADENSAKDMGIVLQLAKRASKELGCAVILVHHTGKNGESERGSSALRGAMDTMIHIQKLSDDSTKAVMKCAKSKDAETWKDQTFDLAAHLDSVRVWWDEPIDGSEPDKRKSETAREILKVLIKAEKELTAKQISEATGSTQQLVNKVVGRLERDEFVSRSQNSRGTWCFTITDMGKAALQSNDIV